MPENIHKSELDGSSRIQIRSMKLSKPRAVWFLSKLDLKILSFLLKDLPVTYWINNSHLSKNCRNTG